MKHDYAHEDTALQPEPWLPVQKDAIDKWAHGFAALDHRTDSAAFHPVIKEFADLIAVDPIVRMYVSEMIAQVPRSKRYREHHLKSVDQMLVLMNAVLTQAPEFDTTALVGCPLNAILDWSMGTRAGFAAFRDPRINAVLKKILGAWCEFLNSPASLSVLNNSPSGWKCAQAQALTRMEEFEHDAADPHWGFKSWNDYFTRRFKPGRRPVAAPDDDSIIVNACESAPYAIARDVKLHDSFWVKGQPYSLHDLLAGDPSARDFVGGTVYQAYLSAYNYHRWHSPVSGTILKTRNVEGTYYSQAECEGEDPAGPNNSQGYVAHVAARAIIRIRADNPVIGHMVVIPVGMAEVSSCIIAPAIEPGAHVKKGDELGYFQFGGSTHCLVFRQGAIESFAAAALPDPANPHPPLMLVNSYLATAAR